jgi:hypothetical protein
MNMVRKLNFNSENCKRQASALAKYSITNHEANRHNLAEWYRKMRNGAWEHQNYVENFGEPEDELS